MLNFKFWKKSNEKKNKSIKVIDQAANQLNLDSGKWYEIESENTTKLEHNNQFKRCFKVKNEDGEILTISEDWVTNINE